MKLIYRTSCPKIYSIYNINPYLFYLTLFICYFFSIKKTIQDKAFQIQLCTDSSKILWHGQQTPPLKVYEQSSKNPNPIHCCHANTQAECSYIPTEATWPRSKHQSLGQPVKISARFLMAAHCLPVLHTDLMWKGLEAQHSLRLQVQAHQQCRCAALRQREDAALPSASWHCPDVQNRDECGSFHCWQSPVSWRSFAGT